MGQQLDNMMGGNPNPTFGQMTGGAPGFGGGFNNMGGAPGFNNMGGAPGFNNMGGGFPPGQYGGDHHHHHHHHHH